MPRALVATWHCLGLDRTPCDEGGTGTLQEVDKAAGKHTDTTKHGTITGLEGR